jgi:hypothetical protein
MAEDFTSKFRNPELEAVISRAQTSSELRELMLQELARQGQIVRTHDDEFDIRRGPRAGEPEAHPAPSLPAARPTAQPTCYRVIYPHGNDRYELSGATEQELDQKEARIRAMFGAPQ